MRENMTVTLQLITVATSTPATRLIRMGVANSGCRSVSMATSRSFGTYVRSTRESRKVNTRRHSVFYAFNSQENTRRQSTNLRPSPPNSAQMPQEGECRSVLLVIGVEWH